MSIEHFDYESYYNKKAKLIDELALTYNHPNPYKKYFYNIRFLRVMGALGKVRSKKVLDIGCGSGYYTKFLVERGALVTATEISKEYLMQAKKLSNNHGVFINCSATRLPFKNNFFDKVLMTEVIEHIIEYEKSIREIKRVLKPGGIAVITTPSKLSPLNIAYNLKRRFKKFKFNEHVHEFTKSEFKKLISKYFSVEKITFSNYVFPYPIDLIISLDKRGFLISIIKNLDYFLGQIPFVNSLGWTMIFTAKKHV